jgi:hypothetical protein
LVQSTQHIEQVWLKLVLPDNQGSCFFGNLYWPPGATVRKIDEDIKLLSDSINRLRRLGTVVICGDLNADLQGGGCYSKQLRQLMSVCHLTDANLYIAEQSGETEQATFGSHAIDHVLVPAERSGQLSLEFAVDPPLQANGHGFMRCQLRFCHRLYSAQTCRERFEWDELRKDGELQSKFNAKLKELLTSGHSCHTSVTPTSVTPADSHRVERTADSPPADIDSEWEQFNSALLSAARATIPVKKYYPGRARNYRWWSAELSVVFQQIQSLRKDVRRVEKQIRRCTSVVRSVALQSTLDGISTSLRLARRSFRKVLRREKRRCWQRFMKALTKETKTPEDGLRRWWRFARIVRSSPTASLLEPQQAVEFWKQRYAACPLPNAEAHSRDVQEWLSDHSAGSRGEIMVPIGMDELVESMKGLPHNKAAGVDDIQGELLQQLQGSNLRRLLALLNLCLLSEQTPRVWHHGQMALLFKKDDRSNPANYRPITLLSHCRKLLESILWKRIEAWIEQRGIIAPNQAGFRRRRGCAEQALILHHLLERGRVGKKERWVVFLDFKNAYDSVSHDGLLWKLRSLNLPPSFGRWLQHLLSCSSVSVMMDPTDTRIEVRRGVPQGSVLSPFLFNVYINDLAQLPEIHALGVNVGRRRSRPVGSLLYADDTSLVSDSKTKSQQQLDLVSDWSREWGLELHPKKTELMICRPGGPSVQDSRLRANQIILNGSVVPLCSRFKYLGIWLSNAGRASTRGKVSGEEVVKAGKARLRSMGLIFSDKNLLPGFLKKIAYTHILRPRMLFGSELYGVPQSAHLVEREASRRILSTYTRTPSVAVRRSLGLWSVGGWSDRICLLFCHRMLHSPYEVARYVCESELATVQSTWGQRVRSLWQKYDLGVTSAEDVRELSYEEWDRKICLSLSRLDLSEARDLRVPPGANYAEAGDPLRSRRYEPLSVTREKAFGFVDFGGPLTKYGFMLWSDNMNSEDMGTDACFICGTGEDRPSHLMECDGLRRRRDCPDVGVGLSVDDVNTLREAQGRLLDMLALLGKDSLEAAVRECNTRSSGKRLRMLLRDFRTVFYVRCKSRQAALGQDTYFSS